MELGIYTFADMQPDKTAGRAVNAHKRVQQLMEEIQLADQVGLDVFAVGEHHRPDYAISAPAVVLGAAAAVTKNIKLSSAVTVLSSDDPVRVFQSFATVDLLSSGRAEIMVGRGSFIESFPLFGYDLNQYDELFSEKLELLLKINQNEIILWKGKHRASLINLGVYPRPIQGALPIWQAVGGTPQSAVRAATLGLPMALAIIGGYPEKFVPFINLYSLISKKPSVLNIDAIADSDVFILSWRDQQLLYEKVPKFERFFRILIENALVAHQQRLIDNMSSTAEERYLHFLKKYPLLPSCVPQHNIASYLGMTPEFLSKIRGRFKKFKV